MKYYLGLDIGGTKMATTIADKHFNILKKIVFQTSETITPEKTLEKFYLTIDKILKDLSIDLQDIKSIGISCGGPLDSKKGIILSPPNLPTWDYVEIVKILSKKYSKPVFIQNDANACALVEWKLGAGKNLDNIIFLTFGTGMGAGLILNGKLYTGKNDMAGEIGHIRLSEEGPIGYNKKGSFEGFCSGGGIVQLAKMRGLNLNTAQEVLEQAQSGNNLAKSIIDESANYLGLGLSVLVDILNPEAIIIGSIYTRCEDLFQEKVTEVLKRETLQISFDNCRILKSELKESLGDLAAIIVATGEY